MVCFNWKCWLPSCVEREESLPVVVKLPIAPRRVYWEQEHASSSSSPLSSHPPKHHHHHTHQPAPRELPVSIPLSLLWPTVEEREEEEEVGMRGEAAPAPEHRRHKHKKHKKHKKHRHIHPEPVAMETHTTAPIPAGLVPRLPPLEAPIARQEHVAMDTVPVERHIHKHKHRKHRHGSPHTHHKKSLVTGLDDTRPERFGAELVAHEPRHEPPRMAPLVREPVTLSGALPLQLPGAVSRAHVGHRDELPGAVTRAHVGHRDDEVKTPEMHVQQTTLVPDISGRGEGEGGGHRPHKKKKKKHKHRHHVSTDHASLAAPPIPQAITDPPFLPVLAEPLLPVHHHDDSTLLLPPSPKRVKFESLPPAAEPQKVEEPSQPPYPAQVHQRSQFALKALPSSVASYTTPMTPSPPPPLPDRTPSLAPVAPSDFPALPPAVFPGVSAAPKVPQGVQKVYHTASEVCTYVVGSGLCFVCMCVNGKEESGPCTVFLWEEREGRGGEGRGGKGMGTALSECPPLQ